MTQLPLLQLPLPTSISPYASFSAVVSLLLTIEALRAWNSLALTTRARGSMQAANFPPRQPLLFPPDGAYATRPKHLTRNLLFNNALLIPRLPAISCDLKLELD